MNSNSEHGDKKTDLNKKVNDHSLPIFSVTDLELLTIDSNRWGGKATNLAQLVRANVPVPPGLVIGTEWYREYRAVSNQAVSATMTPEEIITRLCNKIAEKFTQSRYGSFQFPLIVRSSATTESTSTTSSAGLFKSVVVASEIELNAAIQLVWNSVEENSMLAYLHDHESQIPEMAVLFQNLIQGTLAGIVHTCDVISGNQDSVYIEYEKWRFGAVVNGEGSPVSIAFKKGDHHSTNVPSDFVNTLAPLLAASQRATNVLGPCLELEWVSRGDAVWVVQARPLLEMDS